MCKSYMIINPCFQSCSELTKSTRLSFDFLVFSMWELEIESNCKIAIFIDCTTCYLGCVRNIKELNLTSLKIQLDFLKVLAHHVRCICQRLQQSGALLPLLQCLRSLSGSKISFRLIAQYDSIQNYFQHCEGSEKSFLELYFY